MADGGEDVGSECDEAEALERGVEDVWHSAALFGARGGGGGGGPGRVLPQRNSLGVEGGGAGRE